MESWELENDITTILDLNTHNHTSLVQICSEEQPWMNNPSYFKRAIISELSLLKMAIHVNSARDKGVIGLLRGRVDGDAFIVVDAFPFPLPVEVDVTSFDERQELLKYYKIQMQDGGLENVVGWYRAHTISGVFFCGPDISAHEQIQQLKEPSLVLIIDPATTFPVGKVDVGAFRTYPEGYTPPDKPVPKGRRTDLPPKLLEAIRHLSESCKLDVTYFKSLVDTNLLEDLWNSYCACTNSSISVLKSVGPADGIERIFLISPNMSSDLHAKKKARHYPNSPSLTEIMYFVVVTNSDAEIYESSTGRFGRAKELFTELLEGVGGSGDQITTYGSSFFFAWLTEERAKKLSNSHRVKQIRPSYDSY